MHLCRALTGVVRSFKVVPAYMANRDKVQTMWCGVGLESTRSPKGFSVTQVHPLSPVPIFSAASQCWLVGQLIVSWGCTPHLHSVQHPYKVHNVPRILRAYLAAWGSAYGPSCTHTGEGYPVPSKLNLGCPYIFSI